MAEDGGFTGYIKSHSTELMVLGGGLLVAWALMSKSGESKAKDVLNYKKGLRDIRDKFWLVTGDCEITPVGPTQASAPDYFEDNAEAVRREIGEEFTDLKEKYIWPSIEQAVMVQRITTPKGVTAFILEEMFPECRPWPPEGNVFPQCEWKGDSIFPECTWDIGDIFTMKGQVWVLFMGLVLESCADGEESGFECVTDSQTGDTTIRPYVER